MLFTERVPSRDCRVPVASPREASTRSGAVALARGAVRLTPVPRRLAHLSQRPSRSATHLHDVLHDQHRLIRQLSRVFTRYPCVSPLFCARHPHLRRMPCHPPLVMPALDGMNHVAQQMIHRLARVFRRVTLVVYPLTHVIHRLSRVSHRPSGPANRRSRVSHRPSGTANRRSRVSHRTNRVVPRSSRVVNRRDGTFIVPVGWPSVAVT